MQGRDLNRDHITDCSLMHLDFTVISRATDKRELLKEKYYMVTETNKNKQTKTENHLQTTACIKICCYLATKPGQKSRIKSKL